ncbi:MAG: hypothetical protein UR81_C0001G0018 [Candidatus Levybacteria bacterium GW2011_GWB1_35_5]|nr:MAG: hypothetical protein UR81_C0001G0018 [Candidatus Levybacteria bacterium GW2011_GWB1_35_5]
MAEEKKNHKLHFSKGEAIRFGFEKAKKHLFFFVVLFLIWIGVSAVYGALNFFLLTQVGPDGSLLLNIINWIFSSIITLGMISIALKIVDNKKAEYKDLFFLNWKLLFVYIIANLVRSIAIIVGFILLIIPGIIIAIKLQFLEYLIVDKKMGFEAISKSWEMTKGVKWNLFVFGILLTLINILGALALIVGLFVSLPLSMVATAFVYKKLVSQV